MSEILKHLQKKYNKLGLSRTELAQELGISIATFDRMLSKGESLPTYTMLGRKYMFLLTDIALYFEKDSDDETIKKEEPG